MNKARISYRIDGNDRTNRKEDKSGGKIIPLTREEFSVSETLWRDAEADRAKRNRQNRRESEEAPADREGLNEYTADFGTWQSPYDTETERIAKLIRETEPGYRGDSGHFESTINERFREEKERRREYEDLDRTAFGERRDEDAGRGRRDFEGPSEQADDYTDYRFREEPAAERAHAGERGRGERYPLPSNMGWPEDPSGFIDYGTASSPGYNSLYAPQKDEREDDGHARSVPGGVPVPDMRERRSAGERDYYERQLAESPPLGHNPRRGRNREEPAYYEDETPAYRREPVYEDPYNRLHWEESQKSGVRVSRTGRGGLLRISTSVAGAMVTGAAFGYFVLSMFSGGAEKPITIDAGPAATAQAQPSPGAVTPLKPDDAAPAASAPAASAPAAVSPAGGPTAAASIPARSYTVLQNGIFSTPQSAETARTDARSKGAAAAAEPGTKTTVYVGVAGSKEDAAKLKAALAAKKIEVFAKPLDLPAVGKVYWKSGSAQPLADYLAQGAKVAGTAGSLSAAKMAEASPGALDAASLQPLDAAAKAWAALQPAVAAGIPDAAKPQVEEMNAALAKAVTKLGEYGKSPSAPLLAEAQEALMRYVFAEKRLMQQLTAASA
ncbi:SPOR domain-containing protein [Paenibacillus sp. UNC499MF]|uniref:SPOR domain-containing protein n=1 Tax=Paenibacillus sp. UNC499MF TaxID=1502751 RepID=UPI0008A04D08|nr:SPOR domain-containing protein [Paenibacillus sp. UNC499MF]SEG33846.1 Sporulation related domain-containing protein [Paenibacillus sp. UNC499MF]